jgi:hypothetical protein
MKNEKKAMNNDSDACSGTTMFTEDKLSARKESIHATANPKPETQRRLGLFGIVKFSLDFLSAIKNAM